MQNLSPEETKKMLESLPVLADSTNPIFNRAVKLKVEESIVVPLHEWKGKSSLGSLLRPRLARHGIEITVHKLPNGQGWLVVRNK